MKSSRIAVSLAVGLSAVAVLVAAGCGGSDDIPADAVAVIDGTAITKAQLDELIGRARTSYKTQKREFPKAGTSGFQDLQAQAVAYLVQREEYAREAAALDVVVDDKKIDARIAEVKKQYFGGSQKKLDAQLKQQGYTAEAFRADIQAQLLSEGITEKLTTAVKVTDADVKTYYAGNTTQYTIAQSRKIRHILVKTKAEADAIHTQLQDGGDFAAIAKAKSLDPGSKDSGGELTVSKGQTVAPFDKVAFALKVDELSAPVKTEFGYHLIQALGPVKAGSTTPLKDVEDQIKAQLLEEKKTAAVTDWAEQIQKDYKDKVRYATGYAPPETADDTSTTTAG